MERLWSEHLPALRLHLESEDGPPVALVGPDGAVLEANAAFDRLAGSPRGAAGSLLPELAEDGAAAVPAGGGQTVTLRLGRGEGQLVAFHVYPSGAARLLVGEKIVYTERLVVERFAAMHEELVNTTRELHKKNRALEEARAEIRTLSGILPICMHCKKIRNDEGYWEQVEAYVGSRTGTSFSHGLCDGCMREEYPPEEYPYLYEDKPKEG